MFFGVLSCDDFVFGLKLLCSAETIAPYLKAEM